MDNINIKNLDRHNYDEHRNFKWTMALVSGYYFKLSPFAIHKGVKGIAGGEVIIKHPNRIVCSSVFCLAILSQFQ